MGIQIIITMTLYLGMVNILQQSNINIACIENIQFVDAHIILSRRIIYFQYKIGELQTKVMCVTA